MFGQLPKVHRMRAFYVTPYQKNWLIHVLKLFGRSYGLKKNTNSILNMEESAEMHAFQTRCTQICSSTSTQHLETHNSFSKLTKAEITLFI